MTRTQVLRDKIGTAMTNTKSRTDQFSLTMHGQEGEGEVQEGFVGKEGAQVCVTQKMCHRRKSLTLGFLLPQSCRKAIYTVREGRESHRKPPKRNRVPLYV